MKKLFIVEQSNPNEKGGFVTKLVSETEVDLGVLGKKIKKETCYISTNAQPKPETKVELDMDIFRIVEYPYTFTHEDGEKEGQEETIMLKWLHLK